MGVLAQFAHEIIKAQEHIIGPLAVEQAEKVQGLSLTGEGVLLQGDETQILDNLVRQYERIFGPASVEVCKEATAKLAVNLPPEQLPSSLRLSSL